MARLSLAIVVSLLVAVWLPVASTTEAQPAYSVVASGLDAPRGLAFGPDGRLYVAEAGTGGDRQIEWVPPFRTARVGTTGRIVRLDGAEKTVVASGLQSIALGPGAEMVGVNDLLFVGPTLYALVGQLNALPAAIDTRSLLVRVGEDGRAETVADLGRFEVETNPDGTIPDSNPFDLALGPDGSLYVAEAGANAVLAVTPGGETRVAAVWRDNPVPTGVAFSPSGQLHVSHLSGAPFARGSARVDRVSGGTPEVAVPGLTMGVDLAFGPDGSLYVLEMSQEFVTSPPPPRRLENSGRVLRVTPGGTEVVADGLNFPTKLAFGPDGALYVTNNASDVPPGRGEVLKMAVPAAGAAPIRVRGPAAAQPQPTAAPASQPRPAASPAASPAPAQMPRGLPRTGAAGSLHAASAPLAAFGGLLLLVGLAVRRRRK
jgi:glucose/arabinose dehydrogenase